MDGSGQPHFEEIRWRLFVNTPKPVAAEAIVKRIWKLLQVEGVVKSIEPYWKDASTCHVSLATPLKAIGPEEATFQLLIAAKKMTHGLQTSGPQFSNGGGYEMTVYSTSGFVESGVTWMEAAVQTTEKTGRHSTRAPSLLRANELHLVGNSSSKDFYTSRIW